MVNTSARGSADPPDAAAAGQWAEVQCDAGWPCEPASLLGFAAPAASVAADCGAHNQRNPTCWSSVDSSDATAASSVDHTRRSQWSSGPLFLSRRLSCAHIALCSAALFWLPQPPRSSSSQQPIRRSGGE